MEGLGWTAKVAVPSLALLGAMVVHPTAATSKMGEVHDPRLRWRLVSNLRHADPRPRRDTRAVLMTFVLRGRDPVRRLALARQRDIVTAPSQLEQTHLR